MLIAIHIIPSSEKASSSSDNNFSTSWKQSRLYRKTCFGNVYMNDSSSFKRQINLFDLRKYLKGSATDIN